jgi:peptidoglycan/xylan/chitin deacetylase (PgdA/CDA1 family)
MIAVLAAEGEHSTVREFFELFKTPWEFYHAGSKCSVLICAGKYIPPNSAKIVLLYDSQENAFDRANGVRILSRRSVAMLSYRGSRVPVYGNCLSFEASGTSVVSHEPSRESAAFAVTSGGQQIIRFGYDLFQEVRHLLIHGQPANYAQIPTLELHIALLRDLILECSIPLVEIPPVPDGYNFIACLTHDMDHIGIRNHKFDHTMFGFLYRAMVGSVLDFCRGRKTWRQLVTNWAAVLKLPLVYLGLVPDFWNQYDRYLELEKGLKSTFFVIPKKGETGSDGRGGRPSRRAASYDIEGQKDLLKKLQAAGDEIGLHGIDAWRDSIAGRQEREIISRITGRAEAGVRMHWLFYDERSPAILEAAGFTYDATVGYNQTVGYRAGTLQAFKPMTVEKLIELPLHVMDTALFYPDYLNLAPAQAQEILHSLVANAGHFGGVMTVNWHDRSIAPERLWDTTYIRLLEQLQSGGACFLTAVQAVSWFRKRRAAIFEQGDGTLKIKIPISGDPHLPGLRVRSYQPNAGEGKFSETQLTDGREIQLAA